LKLLNFSQECKKISVWSLGHSNLEELILKPLKRFGVFVENARVRPPHQRQLLNQPLWSSNIKVKQKKSIEQETSIRLDK